MSTAAQRYRWRDRPDPSRLARREAGKLVDRPDWWLAAREMKRAMRRARDHATASHAGFWRQARTEFGHHATRRGLANLRGDAA